MSMSALRASFVSFGDRNPDLTVGAITCRPFAPLKSTIGVRPATGEARRAVMK